MNILLVNSKLYPESGGGPSRATFFLAKEFIKQKHKVEVLCKGKKEQTYRLQKIKVVRSKDFQKTLEKQECKKYDLVISMSYTFLKLLKKHIDPKKIVYRVPSLMTVINSKAKQKLLKEVTKNIQIFAVSEMLKKQFVKITKRKKVDVIYVGIDSKKFKKGKTKNNFILSLGRLSPEKNLTPLINAFSKSKLGKLHIVGDGKEREKLERKAKKSKRKKDIKFLGKTATPEKYYKKSRIFVLPSKYDAFPLTLVEAMTCGLPCIAFKPNKKIVTSSNEIISNNKNGFLVKDAKQMAEKIDLLLSNKKLWNKMSKQALKTSKKYSWAKTAKDILKKYKS
jgi:glycosyltransferase involved in cell wall biosynthesis